MFELFEKDGKNGLLDSRTKRIVLDSKYDVLKVTSKYVFFKSGDKTPLKDIMNNSDRFISRVRYVIVEDEETKLQGIYDSKANEMKLFCSHEKIEYDNDNMGFIVYKNGDSKKLNFEKLKLLKYHPKTLKVMRLKNLCLYRDEKFYVNGKKGKKVEISR